MTARRVMLAATLAAAVAVGGCGGGGGGGRNSESTEAATPTVVAPAPAHRGSFDPAAIYRREAQGVVTVISSFGGGRGLGSGFVVSGSGEVVTNAHVVLEGEGRNSARASAVYVQFGDGNEVRARIVGTDPDSDVALLRVDPDGLRLHPLPLGSSAGLSVGQPVAAIGSPFGERQSLSVGVISATNRTIESLTHFQIPDAIQTDAAINRGNSGGPLLDASGRVVGINSQIRTSSGGNEGVGFAVPIDTVKRSLRHLRADGKVRYAFIGISSVPLYPQLARRLGIASARGALVQSVVGDGPADRAGIRAGDRRVRFQGENYRAGGDVIVAIDGQPIRQESDLGRIVERSSPGTRVQVSLVRGGSRRQVRVTLSARP